MVFDPAIVFSGARPSSPRGVLVQKTILVSRVGATAVVAMLLLLLVPASPASADSKREFFGFPDATVGCGAFDMLFHQVRSKQYLTARQLPDGTLLLKINGSAVTLVTNIG